TGAAGCFGRTRDGETDPVPNSCPQLTPYDRERVGDASWGRPGGEDDQSGDRPRGVLSVYAGRPSENPTQSLHPGTGPGRAARVNPGRKRGRGHLSVADPA